MKQLDGNLPSEWEEILNKGAEIGQNLVKEGAELVSDSGTKDDPSLAGDVQVAEVVKITLVLSVSNMSVRFLSSCLSSDFSFHASA